MVKNGLRRRVRISKAQYVELLALHQETGRTLEHLVQEAVERFLDAGGPIHFAVLEKARAMLANPPEERKNHAAFRLTIVKQKETGMECEPQPS